MFWGHFWPFLPNGDFFQKFRLCHTQLYMGPQHHAKFQKILMSQFWENLGTDGRTDGRMVRRTGIEYVKNLFFQVILLQCVDQFQFNFHITFFSCYGFINISFFEVKIFFNNTFNVIPYLLFFFNILLLSLKHYFNFMKLFN